MTSAIWGAVEGIGKAESENAVNSMNQKNDIAKIDYSAMKQQALAKIEGDIQATNQAAGDTRKYAFDMGAKGVEDTYAKENEGIAQKNRLELEREKQKGDLAVQGSRNEGAIGVAQSRHTGARERFLYRTQQGGAASNWADVSHIIDKKTKNEYTQEGDNFRLVMPDEQKKTLKIPNQAAYDSLADDVRKGNEQGISEFAHRFGFIPAGAMQSLPSFYDSGADDDKSEADPSVE